MLQTTLFPPESAWTPPRLSELPQDWNVSSRVCIDVETHDPLLTKLGPGVRRGGYIVGVSFALDAEGLLAVCIQHEMDHLIGKVFIEYLSQLKQTRIRAKLKKQLRETM